MKKKSFQKAQAAEVFWEKGQTWENNLMSPIETNMDFTYGS